MSTSMCVQNIIVFSHKFLWIYTPVYFSLLHQYHHSHITSTCRVQSATIYDLICVMSTGIVSWKGFIWLPSDEIMRRSNSMTSVFWVFCFFTLINAVSSKTMNENEWKTSLVVLLDVSLRSSHISSHIPHPRTSLYCVYEFTQIWN